ncbi:RNA polymerase sigma factor [Mangrovibacterium diazotrophicum]|uniref:RNA polymerase sigma-70 factor (ECF subfamily) n=1 Tax=Mangrovibacterium diazotrophicum TaxID=1261403 RepID=A0A419W4E6_9BACT|nr:RNA polymerase sigma-70 factor [Mangrovibacterium diazotrophicum]RKD90310.1 RNA polymerase sigma-70 factor (ECF subfamily) [Mangrovibacterium diazotrophicum]
MPKLELNTERELVERFVSGDQMAFEILFHRYKSKLNGFVLKFAPSQLDADDVVQRVFIKLWTQREKVNPDRAFVSFIFTIARHEVVDQLRKGITRKLYFVGNEAMIDLHVTDQEEGDWRKELEDKVVALIENLPERRKQIFRMSRFEGLSYKQIAGRLEISENTVDSQIRHALNYIRKELTKAQIMLFSIFFK